jgi:MFS family permease
VPADRSAEAPSSSAPAGETGDPASNGKAPPIGRPAGLGAVRVLRHREFAIFWVGQFVSMVGTWMQGFAQGWVVAGLSQSAFALGMVNFVMSIPTLLLMPVGGVAADRHERRRILIWTQWVLLVLALGMGWLVAVGRLELWHVYAAAFLGGIVMAYELPAFQSFYPQLVEKEDLPSAISLNQASFHGSRIVGPALAGLLVARWGTAAAFFANAASFLAVLLSLSLIGRRPPATAGTASPASMMREGFAYVKASPYLQALLGLTAITTLCIFPNLAVLTPYYVKHVLGAGPSALGFLMSVSGAGALLGSALLLTVPEHARMRRIVLSGATILVTLTVIAWSREVWVSAVAMGIQSVAISQSVGLASIMVQEVVPDELRGRVMSLWSLTFTGVMPIGSLFASGLSDWLGMRIELQLAAVLYGVGGALLLLKLRRAAPAATAAPSPPR